MQKLIRKKAYKAKEPLKTINEIRERLGKCDLLTIEHHLYYPIPDVYCCRVLLGDEDIRELELGSNGKGLSPRYSLASAYGEVMERLQNNIMFPIRQLKFASKTYLEEESWTKELKKRLEEENLVLDYHYAPDEKYLNYDEVVEACSIALEKMLGISHKENQKAYLKKVFKEEKIACLPYYSLFENEVKYLPYKLIWNMCGTNGMCAGNTPKEAIIQGLSEVFERYVVRSLYFEQITPPTIPLSYIEDPEIINRIKSLDDAGITLTIKDCSLGKGLPVLGFIFHDRNKDKYAFHVGSDPSPLTGLKRCISEFYQGNPKDIERRFNLRTYKREEPIKENLELQEAYYATIGGGMGKWPEAIYLDAESYPFNGFMHPISESDDSDLNYMIDIFEKLGMMVYIRDVSFLDFPAYQIYVPGMSETDFLFSKQEFSDWMEIVRRQKTLLNLKNASTDELEQLASAIEGTKGLSLPVSFEPSRWFPSNTSKKVKEIHRDYLLSRIYLSLGNYESAVLSMESFLESPAAASGPMLKYKAELADLKEGKTPQDNAFSDLHVPECFNCQNCKIADTCLYFPLLKVAKRIQMIQKKAIPNQLKMENVFNKRILFVGCGDGKELLHYAGNQKVKVTGIEPIELHYNEAKKNLLAFPRVKILNCRIQDINLSKYNSGFDEIFMVFPTPQVLETERLEIVEKLGDLLKKGNGTIHIYTEVFLPDWPDKEDCKRLIDFTETLEENSFKVEKEFFLYENLPVFIKESTCAIKFNNHGIREYMYIKGVKL